MSVSQERSASVLLVEDDSALLAVMVECLLREGFRVSTATSGTAAMEASRVAVFDVAVIDVFLPDAGGLGVARALSRQADGPIHVLFVSALSLPTVRAALWPAPVLFKPFKRRELLEFVRAAMQEPPVDLGCVGDTGPAEQGEPAES